MELLLYCIKFIDECFYVIRKTVIMALGMDVKGLSDTTQVG